MPCRSLPKAPSAHPRASPVSLAVGRSAHLSTNPVREWAWGQGWGKPRGMPRAGYDDVVLLTGFPSFPARRMCQELVKTRVNGASGDRNGGQAGGGGTLVHAIVRAQFANEA